MKTIDFTKLGGLPLTQNILSDMQEAYTNIANSLVKTPEPVIISGLKSSTSGTVTSYTEGFVAYQGEVIQVPAGSHHISSVNSAQIKIVSLTTTLIYDNGSAFASKINKVGQIVEDGTGTFLLFGLKTLTEWNAEQLRSDWVLVKDTDEGYAEYRIDKMNKICSVRGWSRHRTAYSAGQPQAFIIASSLPVATQSFYFSTFLDVHAVDIIRTLNGEEYRGDIGRVFSTNASMFPRQLQGSYTEAQLKNIRHRFNFSYPII